MLQGPLPTSTAGRLSKVKAALRGGLLPLVMLSVKAATAASMAVAFILASRSMHDLHFGHLSVWFNLVSFIGVVAAFSQDGIIVRLWFENLAAKRFDLAHGAFRFGWMVTLLGAALTSCLVVGLALFYEHADPASAFAAGAFVIVTAMTMYAASIGRNVTDVLITALITDLPWRLALIAVAGYCVFNGMELTIPMFFTTAAIGMLAGVAVIVALTARRMPAEVRAAEPVYEPRRWTILSGRMLMPTTMEGLSQYAEVILIGVFLHPAAAGGLFAAQRIAAVFPMLLTGILGYTANRTPRLYFEGRKDELQALFRRTMAVLLPMLVGTFALVVVLGPMLLGLFGEAYRAEYPTLILLSLAYIIIGLGGSSVLNLLFTGHEGDYIRIQSIALAARLTLVVILSSYLGSVGAALAICLVNGPLMVALVMASRKRLETDPSALSLLRRKS